MLFIVSGEKSLNNVGHFLSITAYAPFQKLMVPVLLLPSYVLGSQNLEYTIALPGTIKNILNS